jgi:hypothetical protein
MKKVSVLSLLIVLISMQVLTQTPALILDYNLPSSYDHQELVQKEADQLFLILLYKQYKENIVYKNSPYKGLSFQMNTLSTANKLWSDVNFGVGAFTMDFKETGGKDVGGVLFDYPIYMGLDFKLYNQFHFSAGTTFLERRYQDENMQRMLLVNSFLGVTGKFSLNPREKAKKNSF